jgi:hypothetical protein
MNQENRFGANVFSLLPYISLFHLPYPAKASGSNYSMGCVARSGIMNLPDVLNASSGFKMLQGGSNMTGTDFFVNKPHLTCASKCLVIKVF